MNSMAKKSLASRELLKRGFQIEFHSHAEAILRHDFPKAWQEVEECLSELIIPINEIIGSGGGEAKSTQRLRRALADRGWEKLNFTVEKKINGVTREAISHEVDHVRQFQDYPGVLALEIEWNNKDPFFDRDLENYKRLHADGAISVGFIITRGTSLQENLVALVRRFVDENGIDSFEALEPFDYAPTPKQKAAISNATDRENQPLTFQEAFVRKFVSDKFGAATTHWAKLEDRVHRGVGNPCPLVLIGLPDSVISFDE